MKEKEATAEEFTSRKYLRSLSTSNKEKEEERVIYLIYMMHNKKPESFKANNL